MVTQNQLWLQYMQALTSKITLGSGEALQVVYPYITWDWGGRSPMADSFSYEEWMALNVVPADPTQNSNSSAAASQSGFDQAYSNWFNTLAIGDLDKDQHYQSLQDQYNAAATKYTQDYQNAQNTWTNQTGGTGPTLAAWLALPPQIALSGQLNEDLQNLTGMQTELDNYRNQIKTPVATIASEYSNASYQGAVTDPNSGKSVTVKLWNTDPINPFTYVETITDNNFGGDATKGKADSITFDASSEQYTNNEVYGEGGGAAFLDFISIEGEGSYQKIDWTSFSESYNISIQWQDLGTVTVSPEAWYAGANITSYGEGPYATGFSAFKSGNDNYFFGEGGALSRIYTKMIVAYRPTITIDASESFASYLYEQWQTEAGIEIGPFFFGGKAGGSSQQSTASVSNGQLVIQSMSDWPLIVGMVSAWTLAPQPEGVAQVSQTASAAK
ncbi:hypothetical protein LGH70_17835 [Hymenobacter sp. BT635]|uniref:Uncharacterized protein n=1 Tax=Hymenobacter nitidus TaxID=2880929 RepID=A0ABS8AGA0_9BACT|nr:hypothetical protein [Hymenobacter nitidus]MCB2379463.1 hypothetical protein [Hymenobacter nitidus]